MIFIDYDKKVIEERALFFKSRSPAKGQSSNTGIIAARETRVLVMLRSCSCVGWDEERSKTKLPAHTRYEKLSTANTRFFIILKTAFPNENTHFSTKRSSKMFVY